MKYLFLFQLLLFLWSHSIGMTLIEDSPFAPRRAPQDSNVRTENPHSKEIADRFDFRGICQVGSGYIFSIFDSKLEVSEWVKPLEDLNGFRILSYDPVSQMITFSWKGAEYFLTLGSSGGGSASSFLFEDGEHASVAGMKGLSNSVVDFSSARESADPFRRVSSAGPQEKHVEWMTLKLPSNYRIFASSGASLGITSNEASSPGEVPRSGPSIDAPPVPSSRVNRIHNPSGKVPEHLL